ncbi:MAG TPA: hypothetical protein VKG92_08895, partial [Flavobacteriales bacterium]|nr:hypothetical protein [Flavobacteriales bacterium]
PGAYTYSIPGTPPCADADAVLAIVIDPCLGLQEVAAPAAMRWLGQEGTDHLFALEGAPALDYAVLDAMGRQVASGRQQASAGRSRIPMAGLASGLFVVRIRTDRGDRVVRVVNVAR